MRDAIKFLFLFADGSGKAVITFFNLFNLFKSSFIILLDCNSFQYGGIASFIKTKVKPNPKFMLIALIFENSQDGVF